MNAFRESISGIFFILWIMLGIAGFLLFFVNRNAQFKKEYYPWYVILVGVLFIFFMVMTGIPFFDLLIFLPFITLITFINLRNVKFCDSCGKTIVNRNWFAKVERCPSCGEKLVE